MDLAHRALSQSALPTVLFKGGHSMSKKLVKRQKTVHFRNKTFVGTLKNGILTVKVAQTAQGQMLLAGSYNVAAAKWHSGNRKVALPNFVRDEFERAFGFTH